MESWVSNSYASNKKMMPSVKRIWSKWDSILCDSRTKKFYMTLTMYYNK